MTKWILLYKDIAKRFYRCSIAMGINSLVSTTVIGVHSSSVSIGSKPYPGHHRLVTIYLPGDYSYSGSWPISTTAVNIIPLFCTLRWKKKNAIYLKFY